MIFENYILGHQLAKKWTVKIEQSLKISDRDLRFILGVVDHFLDS